MALSDSEWFKLNNISQSLLEVDPILATLMPLPERLLREEQGTVMKALVVYDSGFGNTKSIAEAIAAGLNSLNAKVLPVGQLRPEDICSGDLLVVGSPINGWRPTQKTMEALSRLGSRGLSGVVAAGFDTRVKLFIHGDAAKKITKTLKDAGASIVGKPMAFYVKGTEGPLLDGETSRATAWGEELLAIAKEYGTQRSA